MYIVYLRYETVHEPVRAALKSKKWQIINLFIFEDIFEKTRLKRFSATEIGSARLKSVRGGEPVQPRFFGIFELIYFKSGGGS